MRAPADALTRHGAACRGCPCRAARPRAAPAGRAICQPRPGRRRSGGTPDRRRLRAHAGDLQPRPLGRTGRGRPRAGPARGTGGARTGRGGRRPGRDRGALPVSARTEARPLDERSSERTAVTTPRTGAAVRALLRKELLVELRTLEAGILWVTLLFAAILGVNRLFVADADQGGFDGFLLAPVNRSAMLFAKVLTLLAYLVVLELVAVPAFALLLLGSSLGRALPDLVAVLALADLGVAVIGTLVAALAVHTRARDLLGALLALPLLVPVVIGGARATAPLFSPTHVTAPAARWLLTLGLYDLVFGLIAYALFDFLLED